jgi:hypothetical protein
VGVEDCVGEGLGLCVGGVGEAARHCDSIAREKPSLSYDDIEFCVCVFCLRC